MIGKRDFLLGISFLVAHFALGATLGDWLVICDQLVISFGTSVGCTVYEGEAYNMFGSLCGIPLTDVETYMSTIQILLSFSLGLSLILFFLVAFKRLDRMMIRLASFIVCVLQVACLLIWLTSSRVDLPNGLDYYGYGTIFSIVTAVLAFTNLIII
jgi:hypothetical protein